ncbi:MAG: glycerophosphodiester phosphodiesterase [Rhodobacteraceae bacterium]|nr:MAG: glycerophosphodiester phosphodiesterase [Paracoccaceae bacterium]
MTNPFRRPSARPLVYGHRGARAVLPENTIAGFDYLCEIGAGGVELDIQNARGEVPVVIHDPRIPMQIARDETGNWSSTPGPLICSLGLDELQRYDVGRLNPTHPYGARYPAQRPLDGARIPTLAQFLEWAAIKPSLKINLEIKSFAHRADLGDPPEALVASLLAALARHDIGSRCVISSFDWRVLRVLRDEAPSLARGYLSHEQPGEACTIYEGSPWMDGLSLAAHDHSLPHLIATQGAACWCAYEGDLTADRVAIARELGLAVLVWAVIHPRRIEAMAAMGVDGVITDDPAGAIAILE